MNQFIPASERFDVTSFYDVLLLPLHYYIITITPYLENKPYDTVDRIESYPVSPFHTPGNTK